MRKGGSMGMGGRKERNTGKKEHGEGRKQQGAINYTYR